MRIEYAPATGCEYGQFIVHADSPEQRAILHAFLQPLMTRDKKWRLHVHSWSWRFDDHGGGPCSFNFGYVEARSWDKPWTLRVWRRLVEWNHSFVK